MLFRCGEAKLTSSAKDAVAEAVADAITGERDDLSLEVTGKGESDPVEPNEKGGEDNPEGRGEESPRRVAVRGMAPPPDR